MKQNIRLLLAEDDEALGFLLKEYLQVNDFSVTWCKNGMEAFAAFRADRYEMGIFDIMMPVKDGITLLSEIKDIAPLFPVILLTAKALKVDKLKGFKAGADDYIVKPVDEEELVARINAVLKRSAFAKKEMQNSIAIGRYFFEFNLQQLSIGKKLIKLTLREAELLQYLYSNNGTVCERKQILNKLWGRSDYFARKSMDVFIHKLRAYLGDDPAVKIINIHGRGYMLEITA